MRLESSTYMAKLRAAARENVHAIVGHAARILALIGLFLPWALMDDAASPLTGPQFAVYFWDGADSDYLWSTQTLAFVAFSAAPWAICASVAYATAKSMISMDSPLAHGIALVSIVLFLWNGSNAVDDAHPHVFAFFVPHVGLLAVIAGMVVSTATLTISRGSLGTQSYSFRRAGDRGPRSN